MPIGRSKAAGQKARQYCCHSRTRAAAIFRPERAGYRSGLTRLRPLALYSLDDTDFVRENAVDRQRHETRFGAPITEVFSALVQMLARNRWSTNDWLAEPDGLPRVGQPYIQRRGSVVRRGRVVECLRPVILTLYETLFDPPCRVRLRLRWRLEPLDEGSLALLDASYELNGPARLNRRHWNEEIRSHCGKLLKALAFRVAESANGSYEGSNGQKMGKSTITETNTTAVNGNPTFK
jgi:hypothetical protein